jgi:DNA modification methylase
MCGDSTSAEDVTRLLAGEVPGLMVTDPPYGVEYDAGWRDRALAGVMRTDGYVRERGAYSVGKVEADGRADWTPAWKLFPGDVVYVWHPPGALQAVFLGNIQEAGYEVRNTIIWSKNKAPIGRGHYHIKHEPCFYAVRKGKTAGWAGDRKQTTVWEIDKPQKSETGHSTQKPVECMARPMRNHAAEVVYDPFVGSGTSLVAAEQEGKRCLAMEVGPGYVAVCLERLTGMGLVPELQR